MLGVGVRAALTEPLRRDQGGHLTQQARGDLRDQDGVCLGQARGAVPQHMVAGVEGEFGVGQLWWKYSAAPWSMSQMFRCLTSRFGLR